LIVKRVRRAVARAWHLTRVMPTLRAHYPHRVGLSLFALVLTLCVPRSSAAATIRVPADAATIQQAIDAAAPGDIVLVAPGTYRETVTFRGKAITVQSEQGPNLTIIDGGGAGSVATFSSGETRNAVLRGFTLRNGLNSSNGGGVLIQNSSPSIIGNHIVTNGSCTGGGVYSSFGSPLIQGNTISRNFMYGCTGAIGLGVYIGGDSAAELIENVITENSGSAHGGGLTLFAAGRVVVRSNVIARNIVSGFSPCSQGGGIWMVNFSQATIVNNLVVENGAGCGGGFYWSGSTGVTTFVNNTFADNDAPEGSAILVSGADARHLLYNNIIIGKTGQTAFVCRNSSTTSSPIVNSSDVYSPGGLVYGGTCADQTGLRGNISADPLFVQPAFADVAGDYRIQNTSAAIDAGDNAAPQLPTTDFAGTERVADGNGDGDASVDMGAFENRNQAPIADAGPDRTVTADATCLAAVTLNGQGWDPDGDPVTLTWIGPFGTATGASVVVSLPAGAHVITLTVRDGRGGSTSDTLVVTVRDATPPAIQSVTATPSVLSSPNHQFVPITIAAAASDSCGGPVQCRIVSVSSNEPISGQDWIITGDLTLQLRAERSNKGTGRVYTITIACTDAAANSSTRAVTVKVPR
jgi:parallel beta helix pectate lyase-like protein/Big-like domain-containing protein